MNRDRSESPLARRSFLSRLTAGAAALGLVGTATAQAQSGAARNWNPTAHPEDDWMDALPGQHRFFFDTTTFDGAGTGMLYANNYFVANKSGYDLNDDDLAVIICLRHFSTPFAFNDDMWAKYGAHMASLISVTDPETKQAPTRNVFLRGNVPGLPTRGVTLDGLIGRGVHYAVCDMATTFFAGQLAQATGGTASTVHDELVANRIENAHMVSAGIVAVERAQARRYAFAYVG